MRWVSGLEDLAPLTRRQAALGCGHDGLWDTTRLVEHEQEIVRVEAGEGVRLLGRVRGLRPRASREEPCLWMVLRENALLRPLERRSEERRAVPPVGKLSPQI